MDGHEAWENMGRVGNFKPFTVVRAGLSALGAHWNHVGPLENTSTCTSPLSVSLIVSGGAGQGFGIFLKLSRWC